RAGGHDGEALALEPFEIAERPRHPLEQPAHLHHAELREAVLQHARGAAEGVGVVEERAAGAGELGDVRGERLLELDEARLLLLAGEGAHARAGPADLAQRGADLADAALDARAVEDELADAVHQLIEARRVDAEDDALVLAAAAGRRLEGGRLLADDYGGARRLRRRTLDAAPER